MFKATKKNQNKKVYERVRGKYWAVKVCGLLKVIMSVIVAEINQLFQHETPELVLKKKFQHQEQKEDQC